jgi:flap endonuclease-1
MTTRDPFLVVSGTDVRNALQLTRDEYIDFAILLGTDFSQRITNVGPVRALSFIKEMGCIENVVDAIENHPKYQLKLSKAAYLAQVDIARSVFKTLPPLPTNTCFESVERSDKVDSILGLYGILPQDILPDSPDGWRYEDALVGNYFADTPFAA